MPFMNDLLMKIHICNTRSHRFGIKRKEIFFEMKDTRKWQGGNRFRGDKYQSIIVFCIFNIHDKEMQFQKRRKIPRVFPHVLVF
jgi:hypothetical protein